MATYPNALVTTTQIPNPGANLSGPPEHDDLHNLTRDEVIAIEAELGVAPSGSSSTVRARLDGMWQKIASGSPSAATSFTISIPASTYFLVRIFLQLVHSTGQETLNARVNNDSTAALHRFVYTEQTATPSEAASTADATTWRFGSVNATRSFTELSISNANVSSLLPFKSTGGCFSSTAANARNYQANGLLTSARTLSSLVILSPTGTLSGDWYAEGITF